MTREEFIQQAVLKMLPPVFEDMEHLNSIYEGHMPQEDNKGYYEIVINEAIILANKAEDYYWETCQDNLFNDQA